jgi:hypothetical protein
MARKEATELVGEQSSLAGSYTRAFHEPSVGCFFPAAVVQERLDQMVQPLLFC